MTTTFEIGTQYVAIQCGRGCRRAVRWAKDRQLVGAGGDYELRRPENKIVEKPKDFQQRVDPAARERAIPNDAVGTPGENPGPLRLADPPPSLAKAMATEITDTHDTIRAVPMTPPNRFDPYEALDTIYEVLSCCGEKRLGFEPNDGSVNLPWGDAETIRNQVYALRAYITGMERLRCRDHALPGHPDVRWRRRTPTA